MTTSNRTLPTHLLLLALVAALALLPGCSSFKSSSSPFRWSSASFKSSSKFSSSSSPDGDKKEKPEEGQPEEDQYEDDVKEHTAAFVGSGGDPQTLLVSLAPVAKRHGISNWEQEPES